jgi:transcriptional regulator with XRE-family HTH domain
MSLSDVYTRTGVSKAQISRIENGRTDPRMSTVTRLLSCYGASLSDLEATPTRALSLSEIRELSDRGAERIARAGMGASDPNDRLDRKAARGMDVRAEREALATRE